MPLHVLNLYQKLAVGDAFIKRYPTYSYKHKISAVGGFDTCSFNLAVGRAESEQWLEQHLGNRMAIYVDNPAEPCFEGIVNRIKWQIGGLVFTTSLDQLMNRIQVNHSPGSTNLPVMSSATNDTASQAIYGIKQGVFDAGIQYTTATSTLPNALRDFLITVRAWPRISVAFSGGGSQSLLSVECIGFYHTLKWEIYSSALATGGNANVIVGEVISGLANGTTFINNADTTGVATNSGFNQTRLSRNGQTAWQFLQAIQEAGDGAGGTPYVMGIEPTAFGGTTRRFYYRAANTAIEYTTRLSDGLRIRNKYGGLVQPWNVRPDRGIRISDVLVGWDGVGDDPREAFLEVIEYDGDSQRVTWKTTDNIETEGAFQLRQYFKAYNTPFGARVRQAE